MGTSCMERESGKNQALVYCLYNGKCRQYSSSSIRTSIADAPVRTISCRTSIYMTAACSCKHVVKLV